MTEKQKLIATIASRLVAARMSNSNEDYYTSLKHIAEAEDSNLLKNADAVAARIVDLAEAAGE